MSKRNASMCNALIVAFVYVEVSEPVNAEVGFGWVAVGNPGNSDEPCDGVDGWASGLCGSVIRLYRIAKHEVTNEQYREFLDAVAATDTNALWIVEMGSDPVGGITRDGSSGSFTYIVKDDMGNKPVNHVSFYNAMRFVNWLHNGQPTGVQDASTTEDGVYAIDDGLTETRAANAKFFIPTENEWYKAAYHQPSAQGGDSDGYWLYPTASNTAPTIATANTTGDISNPGANVANYARGADWNGQDGNVTSVGSVGPLSKSFYGTSDQGGNVFEWHETLGRGSTERGGGGGIMGRNKCCASSAA